MKKIFYLFLFLPFSMLMSCSDKDFSPVDMTLTMSGVTQLDDSFYAVSGEDITIESLTVKAIDGTPTGLANVRYYFNGILLDGPFGYPFNGTISTEGMPAGTYEISMAGNLLQEDQPIKIFAVDYQIKIVNSEEDLPAGAPEIGTYSITIRNK